MAAIGEILKSKIKPKEKTVLLVNELKSGKISIKELIDFFKTAKDSDKGMCLSALAEITKEIPKYIGTSLDFIIDQINHKAPRVKWEASEIIANISKEFSDKISKAVPKLIDNAKDTGTVIRWSAAIALTEIAKNNPKIQEELIPFFENIIKEEKRNGVRNIYIKALKIIKKSKKC